MLPLDKPSDALMRAMADHGINCENITAAVKLDLDFSGSFGESWLLFDEKNKVILRFEADNNSIEHKTKKSPDEIVPKRPEAGKVFFKDELSILIYTDLTVDPCMSVNRLIAKRHESENPYTGALSEEESAQKTDEWNNSAVSEIIAYCTNKVRQKLYAFIEITERILRGEKINENDQLFEQFNAKCPKCGKVYKDQHRKICSECSNKKNIVRRLLELLLPYKKYTAILILCMLASSGVSLLSPILNGKILYDNVINSAGRWHSVTKLFIVLSSIFALALVSLGISIIQNRANAKLSTRMTNAMKQKVFSSMMGLSLSYFNKNTTGRLINRVNYDAEKIKSFYIDGIPNFVINILNFIGLTIFLFTLNPTLTLIVFAPVPVIILIFKFALPKLWRMYSKQWRSSSALNSMLGDSLNGIRVVKAFAKEAEETNRFYGFSERLYKNNVKLNLMTLTIFPIVSLLIGMSSQAIWGFGGLSVMGETMSYGEFTTYLGYIGMIFGPLQFFSTFTNIVTDTLNAAERMFEVLDMLPDVAESSDAVDMPSFRGDITFKDVSFHYTPNRPILNDVNLKINAGDTIGLVGHTGSGKSTIANLITRMYDPVSGQIFIDGVDLKKIKLSSLRKNIAIVSQEIFLFRGTIADNIRYAKPNATMEEVIAAAKAANAHDFIMALPEGYETEVGAGKRSLSGGERQRVSIARALLLSPSILILDEATAAMDTETERLIGDALSKLVVGRTSISIAHRLSTLKDCNYIFAIENGSIAEEGSPDELLAKKGVYYKLYTLQSEAMQKVLEGV